MKNTIVKSASVKVMLSYNYNHFESSMTIENEEGLNINDIDDARKNCQRLCDKAVSQYQKAKDNAANRTNAEYNIQSFESQCLKIREKDEQDRTIKEVAMLKQYEDEKWREQFKYEYDYEDDEDDYNW